ncbi:unnamed protein product [Nezara viridula]|uniref:Uncharacterized protein n=1 Tax=Nezara viridula TaxID=85310 RepID=A0A9P0MNI2_NEZVI|nr:unnamed protein product [Nezara viridula]
MKSSTDPLRTATDPEKREFRL